MLCPQPLCSPGSRPAKKDGECCETCQPILDIKPPIMPPNDPCDGIFCPQVLCKPDWQPVKKPGQCCASLCEPIAVVDDKFDDCAPMGDCHPDDIFYLPGNPCGVCEPPVPNCRNRVCPDISDDCDNPFTPPGECCPVCVVNIIIDDPPPQPNCALVLCAAPNCSGDQIVVTPDGECCPVCQDKPTTPDPIKPIQQDIINYIPCPMPMCLDPCSRYDDDLDEVVSMVSLLLSCIVSFVPMNLTREILLHHFQCPDDMQCETKMTYMDHNGEKCPMCAEFAGCSQIQDDPTPIHVPIHPTPIDDIDLPPCFQTGCLDPCYSMEGIPKCPPDQRCETEMNWISGGGDHCPPTGCPEFTECVPLD